MRYIELIIDGESIKSESRINHILKSKKFYWLIDSEIENSIIEIKNNTLIWHDGEFFTGEWIYGIFKKGNFYGKWLNGIFENGNFKGVWKSGVKLI
jgi:superfamily I DNA and/or RNA helicase